MDLNKNSLLSAMSKKMGWLSERQRVLAENIANADTPAFAPKDLAPFDPKRGAAGNKIALVATSPMHRAGSGQGGNNSAVIQKKPYETAPTGNSVIIEEQMMKAAETATDHQAITNLYRKQVNMIRTALGRGQNG